MAISKFEDKDFISQFNPFTRVYPPPTTSSGGGGGQATPFNISLANHAYYELERLPFFDIRKYGAVDGASDNTTAVQAAVDAALAQSSGGTVFFPPGIWKVKHINLTNSNGSLNRWTSPSIRLQGAGIKATRIVGTDNGKILFDCLGRSLVEIADMEIRTDGTAVYQTAILFGRMQNGGVESVLNRIFRVYIRGDFSVACAVSIASESSVWSNCVLENESGTNNYCSFFTGNDNDTSGVSSTHGVITSGTNTNNHMIDVKFISESHNGATPVIIDTSAEYTFSRCSVETGTGTGVKLVTYIGGDTGGVFKGRVNWIGTLWEGTSGTVHYLACSVSGDGHFLDIADIGSTFNLTGAATQKIIEGQKSTTRIYNFTIRDAKITMGGSSSASVTVYSCKNCDIDIYSNYITSTITVTEPPNLSRLKANVININGWDYTEASSPVSVSPDQCQGEVLTNYGATSGVEFDLPEARVGMKVTFYSLSAQTITIDPNGSDQIMYLTDSAGDYIQSDGALGTRITLICLRANKWYPADVSGTWSEE